MQLPTFSPYPRPAHPNPLTPEQVEADMVAAGKKRVVYHLWEGEATVEVIAGMCIYGFPSCVLVDTSIGNGVRSENWDCYSALRTTLDREQDYLDMCQWIATKVTERATGKQFAVGSFSEITVAFQ